MPLGGRVDGDNEQAEFEVEGRATAEAIPCGGPGHRGGRAEGPRLRRGGQGGGDRASTAARWLQASRAGDADFAGLAEAIEQAAADHKAERARAEADDLESWVSGVLGRRRRRRARAAGGFGNGHSCFTGKEQGTEAAECPGTGAEPIPQETGIHRESEPEGFGNGLLPESGKETECAEADRPETEGSRLGTETGCYLANDPPEVSGPALSQEVWVNSGKAESDRPETGMVLDSRETGMDQESAETEVSGPAPVEEQRENNAWTLG